MKIKFFKRLSIIAPAVMLFAVVSAIPLMAEFVFLKDGSIIEGSIVSDAAASVTLRLTDKKMKQISRNDIMRILYTKLKMGKIFIQKRDGKGIVAFIVDEDQESYTFRKELYNPEEFTFKRSEILFMAEKNPSGLQVDGVVGTDRVSLTWLPPYDEVKRYNLYIKQNEKDKYELTDSAKGKSITLKNLSGRTTYYLIVTSVDRDDYESSPSNELKITTPALADVQLKDGKVFKSYLVAEDKDSYTFRNDPDKAEEFAVKRQDVQYITERFPSGLTGRAGTESIDLNWFAPYDRMSGYNIYLKKKGEEYQLVSVSSANFYKLKDLESNTGYTIKVTGVSKDKTETKSSNELKINTCANVEVQLRDGKIFKTFLASEDQNNYSFRDDIDKPESYSVKRSDVMYITGRFPTALRGKAGKESVDLQWFTPYEPVIGYNVYVKKKGEEYQLNSVSSGGTYTLKGLQSNTEYIVKVTGITKDKTETAASNELKITTGNILPDEPEVISNIRSKTGERTITWNTPSDRDGKVEKFRFYGIKDEKRTLIVELKKTEYLLQNPGSFDEVELVAVDDKGDESAAAGIRNSDGNTVIGFYPGVIMPMGDFGKMAGIGYGGMFSYTGRNTFFEGFELGAGAGFYYASGKNMISESKPEYMSFMIAPFEINAGYRVWFGESFSIIPTLSIGGAYFNMKYKKYNSFTLAEEEIVENFIDPMAKCGLGIEYSITESFSVSLKGEYGMFIEKSGPMQFISAGMGVNYRF